MKFVRATKEDNDIKQALENVVLYKANLKTDAGKQLAKKHKVKGMPVFVMFDGEGEEITRWKGYSKSKWLKQFKKALPSESTP